jgi:hypothetical protein
MGWKDWFQKEETPPDPLADLVLARLRVGYLLDYDLRTWQVSAHHRYDFGEGSGAEEWELVSGDDRVYLGLERDDGEEWGLYRKIPIGAVDGDVRRHIREHDDAPDRVTCRGATYYLDESGGGYLTPAGGGDRQGFLYWDYLDRDEAHYLTIEQWGETEFEAALGEPVEEYQFSNILPGGG